MNWTFYKGKKVLITGHTGFKGAWMCKRLIEAGAKVVGYALEPPTQPSLFEIEHLSDKMTSIVGDVRDLHHLLKVFTEYQPEIVIHMAAQPIVRESYKNPVYTYETNVMGTVNLLECVRQTPSVRSVVNVTTDKVYQNNEWERGYREDDVLNGYDPYSNSKSCSELVTSSYINSFFKDSGREIAISTVRAGNVIGGGDFAVDRIIPDCVRAILAGKDIVVRNRHSIRPYQHVLEPIEVYLMIAAKQYQDKSLAGCYNVGPDECNCKTTGELVSIFCNQWNALVEDETSSIPEKYRKKIQWIDQTEKNAPHEANFLKLDCTKVKETFGWKPKWNTEETIGLILQWLMEYLV